jgi:PKD repeat protein
VSAGPNQTANEAAMVHFQGTASGNGRLSYSWTFGDGGTAMGTLTPSHFYYNQGSYTATLTVTSTNGQHGTANAVVTVKDVAPTVTIGGPYTGSAKAPVSFTASASSPSPVDQTAGFTYQWQFGDGTSGSGSSPSHSYALDGIYTVNVTATDKDGAQGRASTSVKVYPVASVGSNLTGNEGSTFNFQGSAIGGSLSDHWDFGDGSTADGTLTPSHVYVNPGSYTATLTVTDSAGLSSSSSLAVTVNDLPPTVTLSAPASGTAGTLVSFTASASSSSPVEQAAGFGYQWQFGDGTTGSGSSPSHAYALDGIYTVTVTATDVDGAQGTASRVVNINPSISIAPVSAVNAGSTLTFRGTAVGSNSFTYAWNFGDGTTASGTLSPAHVYQNPGTYTAQLTATDALGMTGISSVTVTVVNSSSSTPTVSAGSPITVNAGSSASFSQATESGGTAPFAYSWNFGDGTQQSGSLNPSHTYANPGSYTATVTVTDANNLSSSTSVAVTVNDVAPTVTLSAPSSGTVGTAASFSASATDISPVVQAAGFTYNWNFGDGTTGTGASLTHTYTTAGIYAVSVTATDMDNAMSPAATAMLTIPSNTKPQTGTIYYIAPNTTSGIGTFSDPFGLPDLLNTATTPVTQGRALAILRPGDTLDFLGGTYHVSGTTNTGYYASQLISPTVSGTASAPITLQAYPGQTVTVIMDAGIQPIFGSIGPVLNYVRFLGFTVDCGNGPLVSGYPTSPPAFYISGTGNEVGYNEVVGIYVATGDNHDGIRIDSATSAWIHNNNIHGVTGGDNSTGIKMYGDAQSIIEDNYIHGCNVGIHDKSAGTVIANSPIYRRNWLTGNISWPFLGNGYGTQALFYIYDNVFDGSVVIGALNSNSQVYNNLVRCSAGQASGFDVASPGNFLAASLWNNIVLFGTSSGFAFADYQDTWASGPIAYMDYNVYDGAPTYDFGDYTAQQSTFTLAQFRAQGFETHASVVAADSMIFPNIANGDYTLASAYRTAGRYGDPVGPRYSINQIMNASRYGPGALNTGPSPSITQQPQNQTVSVGATTTFSVQVNGAGLFYQWLRSNDGGNSWVTIQGANSAAYTTPQVSTSDTSAVFQCLVSSVGGSVWSSTATLTVTAAATPAAAPSIMMLPSNPVAAASPTAAFTRVAGGTTPTVATPALISTVQTLSVPTVGVLHLAVRAKTAPLITTVSAHPKPIPARWSKDWKPMHLA